MDDITREVLLKNAVDMIGRCWIVWDKFNPPHESEIGFVAFVNLVTGKRWVQTDAVVYGQYWYDNCPTHWLPVQALPIPPKGV